MASKDKPGTERHRDEKRDDRGPVYHGSRDWDLSDVEKGREALDEPAELEATDEVERADEELQDPGTRGAVFGKGGQGLSEKSDDPRASKWRGDAGKIRGGQFHKP